MSVIFCHPCRELGHFWDILGPNNSQLFSPIHLYYTLVNFRPGCCTIYKILWIFNPPFDSKPLLPGVICQAWEKLDQILGILGPINSYLLIPIHLYYTLPDFQSRMLISSQNIVNFDPLLTQNHYTWDILSLMQVAWSLLGYSRTSQLSITQSNPPILHSD